MSREKHSKIIELMESKNVISVKELSTLLHCTEMTVRRNLDELQQLGFVKREHGYAVLQSAAKSTDYCKEIEEHICEKKAIAKIAFSYIHPHQSICLDSGTTIQQLVNLIPNDFPLSVITPSLTAAMSFCDRSSVQVLLPGGFVHHSNRTLLLNNINELNNYKVDLAFVSCRSLRIPDGTFEHTQLLTDTKRALASIADRRILLLDHSKWGVNSICNSIRLSDIDLIITDHLAPEPQVEAAATLGKEILVVNTETEEIEEHFNAQK